MTASGGGEIKIWNTSTGAVVCELTGHSQCITAIAFSPDNKLLAFAPADETVRLWDLGRGSEIGKVVIHGLVQSISFSGDGTHINTNLGNLLTTSLLSSTALSREDVSPDLFIEGQWITRGNQKLLLLPAKYPHQCTAVHGRHVALGLASGVVSILEFAF